MDVEGTPNPGTARLKTALTVEPATVVPLAYAAFDLHQDRPRWRRANRWIAGAAWTTCAVGWLAIVLIGVESVLVSGAVLTSLGVLLVTGGVLTHDRLVIGLGAAHCAVCVLYVVLVTVLNWSPSDAQRPFSIMTAAYTVLIVWPSFRAVLVNASDRRGAANP